MFLRKGSVENRIALCFEFILCVCVWCYFLSFVSCNSIFPVLLPLSSVDKGVGAFVMLLWLHL